MTPYPIWMVYSVVLQDLMLNFQFVFILIYQCVSVEVGFLGMAYDS